MVEKLTTHAQQAFVRAIAIAQHKKRKRVTVLDLLFGLLLEHGSIANSIMEEYISISRIAKIVPQHVQEKTISITISHMPELSKAVHTVIERAMICALDVEHQYIGTEHLLLAILSTTDAHTQQFFTKEQINIDEMKNNILNIFSGTSRFNEVQQLFMQSGNTTTTASSKKEQKKHQDIFQQNAIATPALDYFGVDFTAPQQAHSFDPVIGREKEIDRVLTILARRTKNNPVLIGDPGVGKTAIVEGIAKKIIAGDVPETLMNKRIISLDLGQLIAGTMYRGEFESRLKQIVFEVQQNPDIILFIDEIHMLVGAGSTQGSTMDAANILKPALASGELSCIGATTAEEYKKYIEEDGALDRRFQAVTVNEPSHTETVAILQGLKKQYEEYHLISISDDVIEETVNWAIRFLPEQRLPDKAIDLLDEAGAKTEVNRVLPKSVQEMYTLRRELDTIIDKKEKAIHSERLKEAMEYKNTEETLQKKLMTLQSTVESLAVTKIPLHIEDVAAVLSARTGIDSAHITATGMQKTRSLAKRLRASVIGQEEAIDSVTAILQRAAAGLSSEHQPLGSFLFLGPSGVGKTLLAKTIAREHFGDEHALIRVDMSEFSEGFMMSKLLGAPAGYVGHKESNAFITAIRKRPYSVVLFDELEKAHPDVFQLLLQILDEGRLTDATGRELNFRNTIIIMTSNIGIEALTVQAELGFTQSKKKEYAEFETLKESIIAELPHYFPQEMLNRIDTKIVFQPLSKNTIERIVEKECEIIIQRAKKQNIALRIDEKAKKHLAEISFHPEQGAREITHIISEYIETPLAQKMVRSTIVAGDTVVATVKKEQLILAKKK